MKYLVKEPHAKNPRAQYAIRITHACSGPQQLGEQNSNFPHGQQVAHPTRLLSAFWGIFGQFE
jgi:hypothetical protein